MCSPQKYTAKIFHRSGQKNPPAEFVCRGESFLFIFSDLSAVQIGHFAGDETLDAHAGCIRDGDILLVEDRAAEDVVLAAEHRAVQVHFGDDLLGAGQLHGCVDRDLEIGRASCRGVSSPV